MPVASDVRLSELALRTVSLSGADIATLVNEAAIHAANQNDDGTDKNVHAVNFERCLTRLAHRLPDDGALEELGATARTKVVAQVAARRAVAHALRGHYRRLRAQIDAVRELSSQRPNTLLYGPSGSGKSHAVAVLAEHLGIPFARFNVARILAGHDAFQDALRELLRSAGNREYHAHWGVISLFGLELLAGNQGAWPQTLLADIVRGQVIDVRPRTDTNSRSMLRVDTSRLLFFAEATLTTSTPTPQQALKDGAVPPFAQGSNAFHYWRLQEAGLSAWLLDCFPVLEATEYLQQDDILSLCRADDSPVSRYQEGLGSAGAEVHLGDDALDAIAFYLAGHGGNMKRLPHVLETIFRYTLNLPDTRPITVTKELVQQALTGGGTASVSIS